MRRASLAALTLAGAALTARSPRRTGAGAQQRVAVPAAPLPVVGRGSRR